MGVNLEREHERLFKIGNYHKAECIYYWCFNQKDYALMFIDELPIIKFTKTWYCVKEIGDDTNGDWYWFTLDQLMICE